MVNFNGVVQFEPNKNAGKCRRFTDHSVIKQGSNLVKFSGEGATTAPRGCNIRNINTRP